MKYDLLSVHERRTSLQIEGNSVSAFKKSDLLKQGLRRFENGRVYQASRLGVAELDQLLRDSMEWGGEGLEYSYSLPQAHSEERTGESINADLISEYEEQAKDFIQRNKGFVFSGKCIMSHSTTSFDSNYGVHLSAEGQNCEWYLMYQRVGSGNMFDGYLHGSGTAVNFQRAFEAHAEFLNVQSKVAEIKSKRLPVLFAEHTAPLGKFIESLDLRKYMEGACHFAGRLNQQIFSPEVTIVDQSYDPRSGLFQFFDGEGVVRSSDELELVRSGTFTSLITDLRTGHKYSQPSTGNGVRSYNSGVRVAPRSLRFKKGERAWRELIQDMDQCLVALVAAGGDSNDLGEFSSPVQVGYVFEKGELVGMSPQLTVKAQISDYLGKDVVGVTSDSFQDFSPSANLISEMDVIV